MYATQKPRCLFRFTVPRTACNNATHERGNQATRTIAVPQVRAISRTPTSEKSKALAARGCEVVQADMSDVDSLKAAFTGAACFGFPGPF